MLYKIIAEHNKQQEPQDRALRNPAINWLSDWFYIVYNSSLGSSKQTVNNSSPSSPKVCIFSINTEWLMVSNALERSTSYRLVTNSVSKSVVSQIKSEWDFHPEMMLHNALMHD